MALPRHEVITVCSASYSIGLLMLSVFLPLCGVGCEVATRVSTDGENPPTFTITGTGAISFLRVVEAPAPGEGFLEAPVIWEIRPLSELRGIPASKLPQITYGVVPNGFRQTQPQVGSPPSLLEGKTYDVWLPTYNANGGGLWFRILGGRCVPLENRDQSAN